MHMAYIRKEMCGGGRMREMVAGRVRVVEGGRRGWSGGGSQRTAVGWHTAAAASDPPPPATRTTRSSHLTPGMMPAPRDLTTHSLGGSDRNTVIRVICEGIVILC